MRRPSPATRFRGGRPLVLALLLALAACAGDRPPPAAPPPGLPRAGVELPAEGQELLIVIENLQAGDRLLAVELLSPDGQRTAAETRSSALHRSGSRRQPTVGIVGGSDRGVGVMLGFDLFSSRRETPAADGLSRVVEARVSLPDPADYRARPGAYRIEITYLDVTGDRRRLSFPAI